MPRTTRRRLPAVVAGLVLAATLTPAAAGEVTLSFDTPGERQVVGLGERVAYSLTSAGADCADVTVAAVIDAGGRSFTGEPATGCAGSVAVPWEADLLGDPDEPDHEPIHDWEVHEVRLVATAGDSSEDAVLLNKRYQARHAEVVFGDVQRGENTDPWSGGESLVISDSLTTLSLGEVDLTEVSSLSLRYATPEGTLDVCVWEFYCTAGRALVTSDSPDGPLVAAVDLLSTGGEFTRVLEPVLLNPEEPAELFVTFVEQVPALDALLELSYLEFNGSGTALPHDPGPDPEEAIVLFDGSSLDGWGTAGFGTLPGLQEWTIEDDGSLKTGAGLVGMLWYEQAFADFALRLDFKVDKHMDNSGVFVRFPAAGAQANDWEDSYGGYEVQIDDFGQAYWGSQPKSQTGAIYDIEAPDRVNTRTLGEWNTYEVTAVGQQYTVKLNGRVVTTFTGDRGTEGHIGLQVHDPASTVWFRNIRVIPLGGAA